MTVTLDLDRKMGVVLVNMYGVVDTGIKENKVISK